MLETRQQVRVRHGSHLGQHFCVYKNAAAQRTVARPDIHAAFCHSLSSAARVRADHQKAVIQTVQPFMARRAGHGTFGHHRWFGILSHRKCRYALYHSYQHVANRMLMPPVRHAVSSISVPQERTLYESAGGGVADGLCRHGRRGAQRPLLLHLSPIGDLLTFAACLCWAVYSLLMKFVTDSYSTFFITRKVFLYGLLTILPYYLAFPGFPSMDVILSSQVLWNILFLSVVASMICFLVWNWVIHLLGTVVATNWVYFNPVTTILFAWWLLHEQITPWFLLGTVLIITGMYLCERKAK